MHQVMKANQSGFTLIELIVVCAIIGVLASLAIPNYFYAKRNAFNATAASDVRGILPAADTASSRDGGDTFSTGFGPVGGDVDAVRLPGARSSFGVVGDVAIEPNEYTVSAQHQNGTLCYTYSTLTPDTYSVSPAPCAVPSS